jgi:hypothetical protein
MQGLLQARFREDGRDLLWRPTRSEHPVWVTDTTQIRLFRTASCLPIEWMWGRERACECLVAGGPERLRI